MTADLGPDGPPSRADDLPRVFISAIAIATRHKEANC